MTDTKLNKTIAEMMGWTRPNGDHGLWLCPGKYWPALVPNFLAPERLHDLLDLAATLGRWDLYAEPQGDFFAKIELPSEGPDDDPHATGKGFTPSLAVARAIVAHKKGQQAEGSEEPQP